MSNKMKQIEQEKGKPLKQIILEQWETHGSQQEIAEELGVSQGTVSLWMQKMGLAFKTIIVDERETESWT